MDLLGRDITFAALAKGQQFVARRQELLAQNIANVNTDGYKRHDLDTVEFSRQLASSLENGDRGEVLAGLDRTVAREVVEEQFFARADMNGVDLAHENSQMAESTALGGALVALMAKRISMYKSVLRDGRV
jgi:flagellar basal-body rod protein FlgB